MRLFRPDIVKVGHVDDYGNVSGWVFDGNNRAIPEDYDRRLLGGYSVNELYRIERQVNTETDKENFTR